jgi:hypothetical protein
LQKNIFMYKYIINTLFTVSMVSFYFKHTVGPKSLLLYNLKYVESSVEDIDVRCGWWRIGDRISG